MRHPRRRRPPARASAFLGWPPSGRLLDGTLWRRYPERVHQGVVEDQGQRRRDPPSASRARARPSRSTPRCGRVAPPVEDSTRTRRGALVATTGPAARASTLSTRSRGTRPCGPSHTPAENAIPDLGRDGTPSARPRSAALPPRPRQGPAQPEVHLRDLRHRLEQPVRARGRGGRRRGPRQGLQPPVHLRRVRVWARRTCCTPSGTTRATSTPRARALRELRGVHQRLHQQHPRRQGQQLPDRYREVDVLLIDDIQFLAGKERTRRSSSTPSTRCTTPTSRSSSPPTCRPAAVRLRGTAAVPVRVGPHHRCPAAGPRDPHRDPAQEGDPRAHVDAPTTCSSSSPARSRPTSASSRVP